MYYTIDSDILVVSKLSSDPRPNHIRLCSSQPFFTIEQISWPVSLELGRTEGTEGHRANPRVDNRAYPIVIITVLLPSILVARVRVWFFLSIIDHGVPVRSSSLCYWRYDAEW